LEGLARVDGAQGRGIRAAQLWGAAGALREAIHACLPPNERPRYERALAAAQAQLDPATWEAAWAAGQALTPEQAIAFAIGLEEAK
jgi:hypothetical protein